MTKRALDLMIAVAGLLASIPILVPAIVLIWLQDRHSPLYISPRVGRDGATFRLVKLRSMVVGADRTGIRTTTAADSRVTAIGRVVRACKVDELPQFWNVVRGEMSVVGPRPNVKAETDLYTEAERKQLTVRPGITDLSSIVFSNLAELLADSDDPNRDYNRLIRPWKSRLGLLYVEHHSTRLDLELIALTAVSLVSRPLAVAGVLRILRRINAPDEVCRAVRADWPLRPCPPPGSDRVVDLPAVDAPRCLQR